MADLVKVSPNRMELLKNRRRLALAKRGYKLLKDKYDELVKRFIKYVKDNKGLREEAEKSLRQLYTDFTLLRSESPISALASLIERVPLTTELAVESKNLLNTKVPVITLKTTNVKNYPAASVPLALDKFLEQFAITLDYLTKLAQFEHTVRTLAAEIVKTRRRVNALEHVLIPQLSLNIRFIAMKMDEIDRENRTRLLRVKEMLV